MISPFRAYRWNRDDMFGVVCLKSDIEGRAVSLAEYIIETGGTVRAAAARFGVSKSTVHKDITERLEKSEPALWQRVKAVLEKNKAERHLRGGEATRIKYLGEEPGAPPSSTEVTARENAEMRRGGGR